MQYTLFGLAFSDRMDRTQSMISWASCVGRCPVPLGWFKRPQLLGLNGRPLLRRWGTVRALMPFSGLHNDLSFGPVIMSSAVCGARFYLRVGAISGPIITGGRMQEVVPSRLARAWL